MMTEEMMKQMPHLMSSASHAMSNPLAKGSMAAAGGFAAGRGLLGPTLLRNPLTLLALGVAIPAAPASVGVYEASVVGAFAVLGVSSSSGLAYAIVLHLVQVIVTTVFGLWGMIRDGQNLSTLLSSVTDQKQVQEPAAIEEH